MLHAWMDEMEQHLKHEEDVIRHFPDGAVNTTLKPSRTSDTTIIKWNPPHPGGFAPNSCSEMGMEPVFECIVTQQLAHHLAGRVRLILERGEPAGLGFVGWRAAHGRHFGGVFSKPLKNLKAALALHFACYTDCGVHQRLRGDTRD